MRLQKQQQYFIYPCKAWPVYLQEGADLPGGREVLPPSLSMLLSVEPIPALGCEFCPASVCPAHGQHLLQEHWDVPSDAVNLPTRVQSPEPVSPLLPRFPTAEPGNQTRGNPTVPSHPSKVCSQGASAHWGCNRGMGSRGKSRHQILHPQPKVTMLEGRKGRGNAVHRAIQKVGFVPSSSVWQGNKVNVKTTGRHIPQ